MIATAVLCPAPPLLIRSVTGADPVVPELRQACLDAVTTLVGRGPDLITVVGVAGQTRRWDGSAQLNVAAYAPGARPLRAGRNGTDLPLPVGLGNLLLDQAGYSGRRELASVSEDAPTQQCVTVGGLLAEAGHQAGLLVMADGSARRGLKAPGYLDERSFALDAEVECAIRTGDLDALLAVDPGLAADLMATGRAAWQVLAGAMHGVHVTCQVWYCGDPFGVAYLVASMTAG